MIPLWSIGISTLQYLQYEDLQLAGRQHSDPAHAWRKDPAACLTKLTKCTGIVDHSYDIDYIDMQATHTYLDIKK
jgi:hypothetical protein